MFTIYWAEVSADSDGPVEMCKPVPGGNPGVQWQLASEALRAWGVEHGINPEGLAVKPEDLGVRLTYLASEPVTETSAPTATSPCRSPDQVGIRRIRAGCCPGPERTERLGRPGRSGGPTSLRPR